MAHRQDELLVIEAATNGATPPARNPNVPRTPAEIAGDSIRCIDAGSAIVHNHNDEPVVGGESEVHDAEPYIEAWRAILRERPGAIAYPTMAGGGPGTDIEKRYGHIPRLAEAGVLGMGLIDPGSVNIAPPDAEGLPAAVDNVYINTAKDARYMFDQCQAMGVPASISIFEPGFLRTALAYHARGRITPGSLIKLYFSGGTASWGLPPTAASLDAYLAMLDGTGLAWSVALLGGDVVASGLARLALERGGHVRVGLEDYAGSRTPSNVELVDELVELAASVGRRPATVDEAIGVLGTA